MSSVEQLLRVGTVEPKGKFPPVPEGSVIVGEVPEWLRPWFPSDSFEKNLKEPIKRRVEELRLSGKRIGPDSPEAEKISQDMTMAEEILGARKAVFSAGLKQYLFDAGKFEEGAIMICENWQIARVPLPECNNPLDTLILGALLGRLARS